ncbi:hypothetical protein J4Q44_G00180230 [Coregonus suidteri]|uniref:Ig-like domain-containing protein n=1 Tax=Coregonus suidteri TaxID=861788 RepID=A0AAN8LLZ8_9TELE
MFNNTSPGNLSVLLSHDDGWYRCQINGTEHSDIKLTVKGCTLSGPESRVVNGSPGQSVLLPCSCSKTQAKPPSFTWTKLGDRQKPAIISTQSDLYRGRVQIFNNTSPGNLSVLLSELTEDDQEWYRCEIRKYQPLTTTTTKLPPLSQPKGLDTTTFLVPTASPKDRNAGLGDKTTAPDDPSVLYATVQEHRNTNQEETTTPLSAPEDPSVTYSTIVHMTGKGKAAVSLESSGETEYSSIKTGRFS